MSLAVCLAVLVLSLAFGMPVAFGMIASSVVYLLIEGIDMGVVMETMVLGFEDKFVLLAVPLFIFTARLMNSSGVTEKIFSFAGSVVGHMRGGLAHVNVLGSVIFSGMTGSAIADAAGLGLMELKAMDNAKYEKSFSCAVTAASATIGPVVPPSIPMVIYAMLSGASVGSLFLGGIIPGLIMAVAMMLLIARAAKKKNYPRGPRPNLGNIVSSLREAFFSLLTPVILLGGIYSGVFTPTEAAAVAAVYSIVLLFAYAGKKGFRELGVAVSDVVESTGFLGLIIAGALLFGYVLAREQVPSAVAEAFLGITTNKWLLLFMFNLLFLFLGCFVDTMVILLVVVPVVMPVAAQAGIDLVHFGVVLVVNLMIGLITPPFGMLLFIMSGLGKVPLSSVIRETAPFVAVLAVVLFMITYIPGLVLFLPRAFGH